MIAIYDQGEVTACQEVAIYDQGEVTVLGSDEEVNAETL